MEFVLFAETSRKRPRILFAIHRSEPDRRHVVMVAGVWAGRKPAQLANNSHPARLSLIGFDFHANTCTGTTKDKLSPKRSSR